MRGTNADQAAQLSIEDCDVIASRVGKALAFVAAWVVAANASYFEVIPAASAQNANAPIVIQVAPNIQIDTATEARLAVAIAPELAMAKQAMLLIRGVPPGVTLKDAHQFESGVWGVRTAELARLRIAAPAIPGLKARLALTLVTFDGTILAEASTRLEIVARVDRTQGVAANMAPASPTYTQGNAVPVAHTESRVAALTTPNTNDNGLAPPSESKPAFSREDAQRMEGLMRKGEDNMRTGNVTGARRFFEHAANSGWAPAAIAMGGTYDAAELFKLQVVGGIRPEPDTARKWYQRAAELGASEALQRLQRLSER